MLHVIAVCGNKDAAVSLDSGVGTVPADKGFTNIDPGQLYLEG